jgi:hypothetical protein
MAIEVVLKDSRLIPIQGKVTASPEDKAQYRQVYTPFLVVHDDKHVEVAAFPMTEVVGYHQLPEKEVD